MKSTSALKVVADFYLKDQILIHPNEGFDLGLMNTALNVKIFLNTTVQDFNTGESNFQNGSIVLDNNCNPGHIKFSKKYWKKIGMPEKVSIYYDKEKVLIAKM